MQRVSFIFNQPNLKHSSFSLSHITILSQLTVPILLLQLMQCDNSQTILENDNAF